MNSLKHFITSESGNSAIQYCMISGCITSFIAGPLQEIGQNLALVFTTVARALAVH